MSTLDLDWVILRPALVLSPVVYGGTAMLRGLAGIPLVTPVIGPDSRIQVVSVDDVAETVAFCARGRRAGKGDVGTRASASASRLATSSWRSADGSAGDRGRSSRCRMRRSGW